MPKPMVFKAGMVIYVESDNDNRVFVLQNGVVDLSYPDIETGEIQHDILKAGEFFGVKSALGKYPREETANVVRDCAVVAFTPQEFEETILKNPKILFQMLKVYSSQLRKVNRMLSAAKVKTHVRRIAVSQNNGELVPQAEVEPEEGLYKLSEYYIKKRKKYEAVYVLKKYMEIYPAGNFLDKVKNSLSMLGAGR